MEYIIVLLTVGPLAAISLAGIWAEYKAEIKAIDQELIERLESIKTRRRFLTSVAKRPQNGVRKVTMTCIPEEKAS